jgi:hypothetical protein
MGGRDQSERLVAINRNSWSRSPGARSRSASAHPKEQSAPVLAELESWLRQQRSRISRSASVAGPIDYMLKR